MTEIWTNATVDKGDVFQIIVPYHAIETQITFKYPTANLNNEWYTYIYIVFLILVQI